MDSIDFKTQIAKSLSVPYATAEELAAHLEDTALAGGGDVSLPCFKLAAKAKKPPPVLAAELAAQARAANPPCVERVETAGGYLNFFLRRAVVAPAILQAVLKPAKGAYGDGSIGRGKTVCLDYSSVNIAKEFHIGHLSTTVIGAALYRIYKKLGYRAVGINHLGDWGTQFGKLIVAYQKWGSAPPNGGGKPTLQKSAPCLASRPAVQKGGGDSAPPTNAQSPAPQKGGSRAAVQKAVPPAAAQKAAPPPALSVSELQALYVRFHDEAQKTPALEDEARAWFKKIEEGDGEARRLFSLFKDITMREVDAMYRRLGVTFDSLLGESFYSDKLSPILEECIQKGVAARDDGALAVDLSPYGMPPCLLQKSDGASLYATRDIAAAQYRYDTYRFHKCLYVVAYQQNLHFKQVFKVLELMGRPWAADLVHVAYGMVSLEEGAMSTRKGNVVLLKDCLDTAARRALAIIEQKSPDLPDKKAAAEAIGISAVVFSALYNGRIKDVVFSYDKILNFDGETGAYLLYTAARCNSVLQNAGGAPDPKKIKNTAGITNDEAFTLLKLLGKYPDALLAAARQYEPSIAARLLMDVAQAYNKFYFEHRIIGSGEAEAPRLALTAAALAVLKDGFEVLGLKFLEKM